MEVNSVTMEPEAAERAFREYRAAFMAERNRIDGELMRGYKALADGKTLLSLRETIQKGGVDEFGRPHLAVARADETQIEFDRERNGSVRYTPDRWSRVTSTDRIFELPEGTLPELTEDQDVTDAWRRRWLASLPFIPPQYRPPLKLENYHLLWEAEWRVSRGSQRRDPMLLRRVGGDLFAVVAAWDLTPIEKLVLVR